MRQYVVLFNPEYYRPDSYVRNGGKRFDSLKEAREYANNYYNCKIFSMDENSDIPVKNIKSR